LVDLGVSGTVPLILSQLKQTGVSPDEIGYLVILHAHWDHVGTLPYLRKQLPRAKVLGSAKAREVLGKPRIVTVFRENDQEVCIYLLKKGIFKQIPEFTPYQTIAVDAVVEDGEKVSLGQTEMVFISTPGHTPCSISVYLPSEKAVLISDAAGYYLPGSEAYVPGASQSVKLTLDSIEKLAGLDVNIVGTGHEMVYTGTDISRFYRRAREGVKKFKDEIKWMMAQGVSGESMLDKLYQATYKGPFAVTYPPEKLKALLASGFKVLSAAR